ncbi:hypothetical protein Q3G72_029263 [Acer saccharum]|nr:hypothetical protein Q3G72_029263 [Acer saccharum]
MEGTGSKNIGHELPPNPFTSLSNKNRGIAPACEVCLTTDFERAVALGGQDLENANDKKLKRALASKKYSHKYKLQQHKYVEQLETKAKALQTEIAIKVPRIKYVECHRSLLQVENGTLKQKFNMCSGEKSFKEAQYAELKKEKDGLKQLYAYQQQMRLNLHNMNFPFGSS